MGEAWTRTSAESRGVVTRIFGKRKKRRESEAHPTALRAIPLEETEITQIAATGVGLSAEGCSAGGREG